MEEEKIEKKESDIKNKSETFRAWGLAWELGYTIAVPIILFALGGRFLDKHFGTSPLFLLVGVVVSIFISSWLIYKKTKPFL